jgi:hypothetical protein
MSRIVKASITAVLTASLAVIGLPFGGGGATTLSIGTGCCTM